MRRGPCACIMQCSAGRLVVAQKTPCTHGPTRLSPDQETTRRLLTDPRLASSSSTPILTSDQPRTRPAHHLCRDGHTLFAPARNMRFRPWTPPHLPLSPAASLYSIVKLWRPLPLPLPLPQPNASTATSKRTSTHLDLPPDTHAHRPAPPYTALASPSMHTPACMHAHPPARQQSPCMRHDSQYSPNPRHLSTCPSDELSNAMRPMPCSLASIPLSRKALSGNGACGSRRRRLVVGPLWLPIQP